MFTAHKCAFKCVKHSDKIVAKFDNVSAGMLTCTYILVDNIDISSFDQFHVTVVQER
jgi:hypothetical protein